MSRPDGQTVAQTEAPTAARPESRTTPSWLGPLIVLLVAGGLAIAAFAGGGDGSAAPADPAPTDATGQPADDPAAPTPGADPSQADVDATREALRTELERLEEGDPLALGAVDAPVVMIEWSDFQCPFCGRFARETKPELLDRYVDEGVLRIEWRDLPVLGEESLTAALAGRAAAEQGAFWALHDAIYAEDRGRNAGELDREPLLAMAADLGLDVERFEADLDDPALAEAVQADLQLGQSLGITGTPTFLINGHLVVGAQPTEMFAGAIEDLAAEADAS
jgi:protein-disulfide isomerase